MKAKLKKIGKSQWVIIPNSIIAKLGRGKGLDMTVENNAIVLRKLDKPVRIVGADRVLSPVKKTWDSFFLPANKASDDFLTERAGQKQFNWDALVNSLNKFSADFMDNREQPGQQTRSILNRLSRIFAGAKLRLTRDKSQNNEKI